MRDTLCNSSGTGGGYLAHYEEEEAALNFYLSLFFAVGAVFGLITYPYRHLFSEGPNKGEPPQAAPTLSSRVLWLMVCTFLWPLMVLTGLYSAWILAKRKRQAHSDAP